MKDGVVTVLHLPSDLLRKILVNPALSLQDQLRATEVNKAFNEAVTLPVLRLSLVFGYAVNNVNKVRAALRCALARGRACEDLSATIAPYYTVEGVPLNVAWSVARETPELVANLRRLVLCCNTESDMHLADLVALLPSGCEVELKDFVFLGDDVNAKDDVFADPRVKYKDVDCQSVRVDLVRTVGPRHLRRYSFYGTFSERLADQLERAERAGLRFDRLEIDWDDDDPATDERAATRCAVAFAAMLVPRGHLSVMRHSAHFAGLMRAIVARGGLSTLDLSHESSSELPDVDASRVSLDGLRVWNMDMSVEDVFANAQNSLKNMLDRGLSSVFLGGCDVGRQRPDLFDGARALRDLHVHLDDVDGVVRIMQRDASSFPSLKRVTLRTCKPADALPELERLLASRGVQLIVL